LISACVFAALAVAQRPALSHGGYLRALGAAAMTLCLAWRHRYPLRTWAIITPAAALLLAIWPTRAASNPVVSGPGAEVLIPLLLLAVPPIALYQVAAQASRARGRAALVLSAIAAAAGLSRNIASPHVNVRAVGVEIALIGLGALVTAWALGERERASREAVAALAERAAALDAEHAERERAAVAGERARVAGELHDIIAHHISVVALQAGAARMLAESGAPPDSGLLRGIETASRQVMTEIRQALGVIRSSADGPAPRPGAAQLTELTGRMALAGLVVTIADSPGVLPSHLDLSTYRIVQEGLTNVLRHSAAGAAMVTFRRHEGQLEITVADDGPARERSPATGSTGPAGRPGQAGPIDHGGPIDPGGHGLIGLRERADRLGGQLRAGPRADGGFEVRALLPLPEAGPAADGDQPRAEADGGDLPAGATL
jgi:signal transduction histidine kinase